MADIVERGRREGREGGFGVVREGYGESDEREPSRSALSPLDQIISAPCTSLAHPNASYQASRLQQSIYQLNIIFFESNQEYGLIVLGCFMRIHWQCFWGGPRSI